MKNLITIFFLITLNQSALAADSVEGDYYEVSPKVCKDKKYEPDGFVKITKKEIRGHDFVCYIKNIHKSLTVENVFIYDLKCNTYEEASNPKWIIQINGKNLGVASTEKGIKPFSLNRCPK